MKIVISTEMGIPELMMRLLVLPRNKGKKNKHTAILNSIWSTAQNDSCFADLIDVELSMSFPTFSASLEEVDEYIKKMPYTLYRVLYNYGIVKGKPKAR